METWIWIRFLTSDGEICSTKKPHFAKNLKNSSIWPNEQLLKQNDMFRRFEQLFEEKMWKKIAPLLIFFPELGLNMIAASFETTCPIVWCRDSWNLRGRMRKYEYWNISSHLSIYWSAQFCKMVAMTQNAFVRTRRSSSVDRVWLFVSWCAQCSQQQSRLRGSTLL